MKKNFKSDGYASVSRCRHERKMQYDKISVCNSRFCSLVTNDLVGNRYGSMFRLFAALVVSMLFVDFAAAETAKLKMRFVFDGEPPPQEQLKVAPGNAPVFDERLVVDPKSKGIKNVLVCVYTGGGRSKIEWDPNQYTQQTRVLKMENGRFDPHILIAQAGDTLKIVNKDWTSHNPKLNFFANTQQGNVLPLNKSIMIPLLEPEPAPISVDCNVHPWMRAYVVVLDHPFAAVTDSDGNLEMDGLPTGRPLTFRVFHEAGKIGRVKISGVDTIWEKSRFTIELDSGDNDLGDVLVPPRSFTR
jgi:plastocyanin